MTPSSLLLGSSTTPASSLPLAEACPSQQAQSKFDIRSRWSSARTRAVGSNVLLDRHDELVCHKSVECTKYVQKLRRLQVKTPKHS